MRVLHVVSQIGTYGGERFVPALARAQRRLGIDAQILTIYEPAQGSATDGVPLHSVGRRGNNGAARGGGPLFFFHLLRELRARRPDVVHTHLAHAKHWGRLAAVLAGARHIVHTEHGNAFDDRPPKRWLTRLLHRRTARVVAFSGEHARRIACNEGMPEERIAVIPSGIEMVETIPESDVLSSRAERSDVEGLPHGDAKLVLCIGRLEPVKGYDLALDALALLPANVHLAIAGDGSLREALVQRAEQLGIRERLHLLGYRSDIATLLAATDVVLNTSRSEAMPLSLIEALCAGVPVVTTPWPGAGELARYGASLSENATAPAVASAVNRAVEAESTASSVVLAAREHFCVERAGQDYAALYSAITPFP